MVKSEIDRLNRGLLAAKNAISCFIAIIIP